MCPDLTEEEMRRALFGSAGVASSLVPKEDQNEALLPNPAAPKSAAKRKVPSSAGPKVVVTLRVGNEFEGRTELLVHEASTLSTLQAELDATKAARKKFRYVELVSVKPSG